MKGKRELGEQRAQRTAQRVIGGRGAFIPGNGSVFEVRRVKAVSFMRTGGATVIEAE